MDDDEVIGEPGDAPPKYAVFVAMKAHLTVPVLIVGVIGGLIGAAYVGALNALQWWIGPGDHAVIPQVLILVGAGVFVAVGTRLLGESGDVELLVDNIHVMGGNGDVRRLRSLIPTSLVCVGVGGSMGPEAPLVQTCGTFGSWLSDRFGHGPDNMRILTITGMAAGFSVLFGAPLGAALFALEILHRRGLQYYEALLPALIGSLAGYAANVGLTGLGLEPMWRLPDVGPTSMSDLGWAMVCGLLGAGGAVLFTVAATWVRALMGRVPPFWLPVLGGIGLAGLWLWSPYALTNGEAQVTSVLSLATAGALAVAMAAKFFGVIVTIGSRWKGGFIIPLFFIGIAGGQLIHLLVPSSNAAVLMAGLAVGLCVGVTKTPLGSTLAVTRMAGMPVLPMTLIAAVLSMVLTSGSTMIDTQRERTLAAAVPS